MAKAATNPAHPQPPDFGPIIRAWRITAVFCFSLGAIVLAFGCGLLLLTLYGGNAGAISELTKIAGGMITVTSLGLFNLGHKRFERIGIMQTLQLRWVSLATSHGSSRELAELNRIVTKMLRDNLARGF
jgi:hypothetical protein